MSRAGPRLLLLSPHTTPFFTPGNHIFPITRDHTPHLKHTSSTHVLDSISIRRDQHPYTAIRQANLLACDSDKALGSRGARPMGPT
jgi:hypothetical protein